jgi:large subunit ribosomal protein L31
MKSNIHPQWNHQATVKCGCGNTFQTGSTLSDIQVDVCSACHPFYTGETRFVDTQGRVERFMNKRTAAAQNPKAKKKSDKKKQDEPKSLRDLLQATKSAN